MLRLPHVRVTLQALALLGTALAVAASQEPLDAWSVSDGTGTTRFVLGAEDPIWTGTLVVTSVPADLPTGQPLVGSVEVSATAFWTPPEDEVAPERPEFSVSVAPEGLIPRGGEVDATVLFERETTMLTVSSTALEGCTDGDTCSERFTVEVRRGGPPSAGSVDIELSAAATVLGSDGDFPPPGFDVVVSLE